MAKDVSDRSTSLKQKIKNLLQKVRNQVIGYDVAKIRAYVADLRDLVLHKQTLELQSQHSNPLNRFGKKCFSQTDEDGITLEIIRRLGIENGLYAEFGVGDGLENNTLILAALGWNGFWVGNEDLAFDYSSSKTFLYIKDWVTLDNISQHTKKGINYFANKELDVLSLDLDGNDLYFLQNILENNVLPKLFIVEYNARFPPPIKFQIQYDPNHRWEGDDYYGASLSSFVEVLARFNYTLICCNSHSGANAFFIRNDFVGLFKDVPTDINDIYVGSRWYVYLTVLGQKPSTKVIEKILGN